jgi:nitrite reductase/ring-hydroxylating ferredoxin subunit
MQEDVRSSLNPATAVDPVLCEAATLAPGALHAAELTLADGSEEALIVHRDAAGNLRAWHNVCPHAGRRLDWAPGKFLLSKDGLLVCAAHGAAFALEDGRCVSGPCRGQALRAVTVAERGASVVLLQDAPAAG